MICIACPIGCRLTVDDDMKVSGNKCPKGEVYALKELTNPTRIVTSTCKIQDAVKKRIPVRTDSDIPKELIFKVMAEINAVTLKAPVKMGDVVIRNVCGTGVDVITSRSMKKS